MEKQRLHVATLIIGLLFIGNAIGSLADRYDRWDDAKVMVPIALLVIGVAIIGNGFRTLLRRDDA